MGTAVVRKISVFVPVSSDRRSSSRQRNFPPLCVFFYRHGRSRRCCCSPSEGSLRLTPYMGCADCVDLGISHTSRKLCGPRQFCRKHQVGLFWERRFGGRSEFSFLEWTETDRRLYTGFNVEAFGRALLHTSLTTLPECYVLCFVLVTTWCGVGFIVWSV